MPYGVQWYPLKIVLDLTRKITMNDIPNFAAWNNENLAQFATESYRKMQEQHDHIEQLQGDLKDAMVELRRLIWEASK